MNDTAIVDDVTFAVEHYDQLVEDLKVLLPAHWAENSVYDDIPLDPDWEIYRKLDDMGSIAAYTVRLGVEKHLIGYSIFFVRKHQHYKQHSWAVNDVIWLHPAHRNMGVGRELVRIWELDLADRGIAVVHVNAKTAQPALGYLLKACGYANIEQGWSKRIG